MDLKPKDMPKADRRLRCSWCGIGHLDLIEEHPHPLFGILGVLQQTFECDRPSCAKLTLD